MEKAIQWPRPKVSQVDEKVSTSQASAGAFSSVLTHPGVSQRGREKGPRRSQKTDKRSTARQNSQLIGFYGRLTTKEKLVTRRRKDHTPCASGSRHVHISTSYCWACDLTSTLTSPPRSEFNQRIIKALPPVQGPIDHSFWDPEVDIFDPPLTSPQSPFGKFNSCDRRLQCRRRSLQETRRRKVVFQQYSRKDVQKALYEWLSAKPALLYIMPCVPEVIPGGLLEFVMVAGQPLEVGSGVYGCVFLGRLMVGKGQSVFVAIKLFKKRSGTTESEIMKEAAFMHYLNGRKVAPYLFGLTVIQNNSTFGQWALVFEFIGDEHNFQVTDLSALVRTEYLSRKIFGFYGLHWFEIVDLLRRVLECLRKIHESGIVINDLKANNILFKKTKGVLIPYITDFGLSKYGDYKMDYSRGKTPDARRKWLRKYWHIDPDLFERGECFSEHDMYSFGIILREVGSLLNMPEISDLSKDIRHSQPRERAAFQRCGSASVVRKLQLFGCRINNRNCICHRNILGSRVEWFDVASRLLQRWRYVYVGERLGFSLPH